MSIMQNTIKRQFCLWNIKVVLPHVAINSTLPFFHFESCHLGVPRAATPIAAGRAPSGCSSHFSSIA